MARTAKRGGLIRCGKREVSSGDLANIDKMTCQKTPRFASHRLAA